MLTHLPEAPTFTSGFAGAWARVAASGKVLIYKADSGLVWWARWPGAWVLIGRRRRRPAVHGRVGDWREETRKAEGGFLPNYSFSFFLPPILFSCLFFYSFLSSTLIFSRSLSRSPDENSTNQQRINRDSDNTTSNSPFTATGATRGPTQHYSTAAEQISMHVYATISIRLGDSLVDLLVSVSQMLP